VTLGVCGPNSFDERGLMGLAYHPGYARRYSLHLRLQVVASGSWAANVRVWQLMSQWRGSADGDAAGRVLMLAIAYRLHRPKGVKP